MVRSYLFYTNIDQALNKKDDLSVMIGTDKPDIKILAEVILKVQANPIPILNWMQFLCKL